MKLLPLVLLAATLATTAPALAQQQTPDELAEKVAGCYTLEIGPWPEALDRDYDPDPASLERQFHLYPERVTAADITDDSTDAKSVEALRRQLRLDRSFEATYTFDGSDRVEEGTLPNLMWWAVGRDSLSVHAPIAFAGFGWRFRRDGEVLRGHVTSFTDYVKENKPTHVTAPVVARPVPCPPER